MTEHNPRPPSLAPDQKEEAVDHSWAQPIAHTCSGCQQTFTPDIWVIVDQVSRPELMQQLQDHTLNQLSCPHCRQALGVADEPLLVYRPTQEPPLLFVHADKTLLPEDQAHNMHRLVEHLLEDLHSDDQEWVMEGLKRVPRGQLSEYLLQDL